MKLPRRDFLHLALGAAAPAVSSNITRAQTYPARTVRIVVPFAPADRGGIFVRAYTVIGRIRPVVNFDAS
jgi:hypothetical protein